MPAPPTPPPVQLVDLARQLYPSLDRHSYYQLLGVAQNADLGGIRAAYYRLATQLHPDRYHNLPDAALREQLVSIYARINEGYRVLINPEKRAAYDRALAQGKLRFELNERAAPQGPKNPEDTLVHPEAKKFFRLGMMSLGKKDWKGAVMNFNFAKTFEPNAPAIAAKLAEAQAGLKGPAAK